MKERPRLSGEKIVDLREHFYAHRSWFFGAFLGCVVFSLFKDVALHGHLPPDRVNRAFQFAFCAASLVAAVTRNEVFHKLFAPFFGLLYAAYIALLFSRL